MEFDLWLNELNLTLFHKCTFLVYLCKHKNLPWLPHKLVWYMYKNFLIEIKRKKKLKMCLNIPWESSKCKMSLPTKQEK